MAGPNPNLPLQVSKATLLTFKRLVDENAKSLWAYAGQARANHTNFGELPITDDLIEDWWETFESQSHSPDSPLIHQDDVMTLYCLVERSLEGKQHPTMFNNLADRGFDMMWIVEDAINVITGINALARAIIDMAPETSHLRSSRRHTREERSESRAS